MKQYYYDITKESKEYVIRELARAKYHMMLNDPELRKVLLTEAYEILKLQIQEHYDFYLRNKKTEYDNEELSFDDIKLIHLHDCFESVEALMCDFYMADDLFGTIKMPRIFSI